MRAQPQLFVRRYEDANDPTAWTLLDLYDTDPIKMNLRVQDIMDPTITAASYTQTFRVPHSSPNGVFFQQAFNVNQTLFDPAKKVQAYINNEGQLWMQGTIQLMNVFREDATGKIEYEILFINELSDFATQIGLTIGGGTGENQGGFLTDLDLTDYTHDLNYSNITLSWYQQLGGSGGEPGDIVYPLIEWGYNYTGSGNSTVPNIPTMATTGSVGSTGSKPFCDPNFPLLQGQMKPALRLKAIWDKIFERTEYTYESEYIQGNQYVSPSGVTGSRYGDEFRDLYIISEKYARATLYESGTGGTGPIQNVGAKLAANYFWANPDSVNPANNQIYYLNTVYDLGSNFNVPSQVFTISLPGQYTFQFEGSYQFEPGGTLPSGSEYFVFALKTPGGATTYDAGYDNFAAGNYSGDILASATYTFAANDTIQFYGSIVGNPNIGSAFFSRVSITTVQIPAGDGLPIKNLLPDNIKQIDFIKSVNQRFQLVWEPSKTKPKHFIITPWTDWIRQGTVKDWTNKLDDKKSYKLTPLFQSQPRFVTYKDQEDSDYLNYNYSQAYKQVYGQLNLDSQIEIIKGIKEVQGIFAPLQIGPIGYGAGATGSDVLDAETFLIPHIAKTTVSNEGPGKREPIQPKLRLAWYNQLAGATGVGPGINASRDWYLKDDSGVAQAQNKIPLMSAYYPNPWTEKTYLLDWTTSPLTWDAGITGNPNPESQTNFERWWSTWYNATYGQIINYVDPITGFLVQSKDYAYIFEGEFILDYKDIIDLRFNDFIWIKDAYYIVNSINDYVVGQRNACKVVLYKINNSRFSIPSPNLPVGNICYSSESLCDAVCCQLVSPITVIFVSEPNNIVVGTRFFLNAAGSIFAPAGFYSDGTYVYTLDINSQVSVINTIDVSPAICSCIPDLDPLELCYVGATGDSCLACCCQGATGEFWMEDATATWYQNNIIYANSTGSAYPTNGWYSDGSNFVFLNNGLVTQSGTCSNCNCLIYDITQYTGCTGAALCDAVCCVNNLNYTFWADSDNLNTATFLFSDQTGTPVTDGWYFNGLAAVEVAGGSGAVAATGSPASCQPCGNETLDVYFDFVSNVNGTGSFEISKSFNGVSFIPESVKDLSTIPANTTFNYTGAVATGTFVRGTLVYGAAHDTGTFNTKIEGGANINLQNTVRFSTYTYTPPNATTGGNEYRFSVNLTGTIYDCALTGGTAWKCETPSCNITGGNSVYVYDTNIEVCCDPLYIYDAGVARIDDNTEVFLNGNCTGATGTCFQCDDFVGDSYEGNDYHQYDPVQICNGLTTSTIEFYWYSIDRPNRFNLYDNSGLVATSGWVGFANYPGPWGGSLSTPSSGTIGALYTSDMYLLVEAGPASPYDPISDTWNGNFVCSTSCFQYLNEMGFNWIGDYQDCNGTWYYGATITPGNSVCAVAGSIYNISGTLTQTYSCIS